MIDVVMTEYNRPNLMRRTLASIDFRVVNKVVIHRDGMKPEPQYYDLHQQIETIFSPTRVGQVIAHDKLMQYVTTEYALATEEDFLCVGDLDAGIKEAIEILEKYPDCASVSLRGTNPRDHNGHTGAWVDGVYRLDIDYKTWSGWSWAPSLRRTSDYKRIGSYASITTWSPKYPWNSERDIGHAYRRLGMWCAATTEKIFDHIGGGELSTVGK